MNGRTTHRTTLLLATLLIALLWTPLYPQNRITGSPDAEELRLVWEERGRENRVDEYGTRMWGGVDITGDGVEDFAVYDVEGALVVEGEVDPQGGSAVWECGDVATGSYLLVGYGADGEQIASASVVKL